MGNLICQKVGKLINQVGSDRYCCAVIPNSGPRIRAPESVQHTLTICFPLKQMVLLN